MNDLATNVASGCRTVLDALCRRLEASTLGGALFRGRAVFGPIRSEGLGLALGINTLKSKKCTYDCRYCQAGRTPSRSTSRSSCLAAYELYCIVRKKLDLLEELGVPVDALLFSPNGEPTLDANLGQNLKILHATGLPIAVTTNASLLWNGRVQEALLSADQVMVKLDTVLETTWRVLDRPHPHLRFDLVLAGIQRFSRLFGGVLVTETMLVKGINDTAEEVLAIGRFLESMPGVVSCFKVPTLPPGDPRVQPPPARTLAALQEEIGRIPRARTFFVAAEEAFFGAGQWQDELLSTLSAHPMERETVNRFLATRGVDPGRLRQLMATGAISLVAYDGRSYCTVPQPVT